MLNSLSAFKMRITLQKSYLTERFGNIQGMIVKDYGWFLRKTPELINSKEWCSLQSRRYMGLHTYLIPDEDGSVSLTVLLEAYMR